MKKLVTLLILTIILYSFVQKENYRPLKTSYQDTPILKSLTNFIDVIDSVKHKDGNLIIVYAYGYPFKFLFKDSVSINKDSTYIIEWYKHKIIDSIEVGTYIK